jgi:hypothetical protein
LIRIRICPYGSGSGIIIPDPDPGRLLLEQAHHVVTPIQEIEYANLARDSVVDSDPELFAFADSGSGIIIPDPKKME